jgi:hypothetical protein
MNAGRKVVNDHDSDADMEPYSKRSDSHTKVSLPPVAKQGRQYQEEEKLVDPLIQQLSSNRDDDPLLAFAGTKRRGRRLTRRAAAEISESMPEANSKITIKLGSSTVQAPPMSSSVVEEEGLIGKSTRSGRGRRVARANLKEDSESDFNDLD